VNGLSALIETLRCELSAPSHSEICRLHRAFAALLREIYCVSCHRLSPSWDILSIVGLATFALGATGSNTSCSCNFKKTRGNRSRGGTRAKTRRNFERCHPTSLLAQSQNGVAVNCSTAMEREGDDSSCPL